MANTMRLIPWPTNEMYRRSGFLIHGGSRSGLRDASEGCIVLNPNVGREIAACGGGSRLQPESVRTPTQGSNFCAWGISLRKGVQ